MNLKVHTAQARKEKVLPKPDQEPKFATTYALKPTSHVHAHQDHAQFAPNEFIIDFNTKINFIT
jgi:hypothetical protein